MRQNSRFAVIFIAALVLFSCTDKRVVENLDYVDSIMQEEPERALEVLDSISKSDLKSGRVKARYALLYSMALDKNYIDTTDVSVIRDAQKYYSRKGSDRDKMLMYYYLGRIYFNAGQYDKAIVCYEQAKEHGLRTEEYAYIGRVYNAIANTYEQSYNYKRQYDYICLAEEYYRKSGNEDLVNGALVLKAGALQKLGDTKKAISIFEQFVDSSDYYIRINSILSLACLYEEIGDYSLSYQYFNVLFEENYELTSGQYCVYAYDLIKMGYEDEGNRIISEIENMFSEDKVLVDWYKLLIAEDKGDYKTAFKLYENVVNVQDSVLRNTLMNSIEHAQIQFFEHQMLIYQEQSRNKTLNIINLCFLSLLIIIGLTIMLLWQIHKSKIRESDFHNIMEVVNSQVANAKNELADIKQKIQKEYLEIHKEQFSRLGMIAEAMVDKRGNFQNGTYKQLKKILSEVTGEDSTHREFEKELNRVFDNVMEHFRSDFVNLKENDYLFVSFVFAGFDQTSICVIMNMPSQGSVAVKKFRMKSLIQKSDSVYKEQFLGMF